MKKDKFPQKAVKKYQFKFQINLKNLFIWLLVLGIILSFFISFPTQSTPTGEEIPLSQALSEIKDNKIKEVKVEEDKLILTSQDDKTFFSRKETQTSFTDILKTAGIDPATVNLTIKDVSFSKIWMNILGGVLPFALMILFFFFIFRQARGAQDSIFSFGRSRAQLFAKGKQAITFKDVAGVDEAKKELQEIVDFLKHPGKYRKLGARTPKGVLLVGPSGTGKCVTGETIIWTNKGLMEIADVPKYYWIDPQSNRAFGVKVDSVLLNGEIKNGLRSTSHWYCLGEQKTIKIKLASGFAVEGTPEHPVVIINKKGKLEFRELKNLKMGEAVGIQFGQNRFGQARFMDEETAYLLGLLTGDGNLSIASRVALSSDDSSIIKFYKNFLKNRFPQTKIYHRQYDWIVSSWEFKKYLYLCGMSYLLAHDKQIPSSILQSSREIVVAFLRGLFDTDGSIERKRAVFEYTTVSLKLARQIQMLLLNLGIVPLFNVKGKTIHGYKRSVYRINITGTYLPKFCQAVGFRLPRKQKLLENWVRQIGRGVNTNVDLFYHLGQIVDNEWREISRRGLSNEYWSKAIYHVRKRNNVSRIFLERFLDFADRVGYHSSTTGYLCQLLKAKIYFSPVAFKEESEGVVYDFTVPTSHSFIGNGFINHNTLLAKAVAGEAGVSFFSMAGSEFMEMLVGVGASRVRDLFNNAKKAAPSIIFIDEIDAIGRQRGLGFTGGHDEREQTLNQILVEMDGFTPNDNVIVLSATNRGDLLDPALLRPGRFDRRVVLDMPDVEDRKAILAIHARGKPFDKEVNWDNVAKRTVGFSGADLENMLNEAAILAARENRNLINSDDIEEAATKVKLGPEKKRLQSQEERKMTAYHEAGHAVVSFVLPHIDPVHRISIVSRGMAMGFTLIPPKKDRYTETKSHLLETITTLLGGRAAEELIFNEFTAGAASDIDQATRIARQMVVDFGMSGLGPIYLGPQIETSEWGRSWVQPSEVSPEMQAKVDKEIKKIVDESYQKALEILKKSKKKLAIIADKLVKQETLEGEEFEKLMK